MGDRQRGKIMQIAGLLEDQQTIPVVAEQLGLIQDIQSDEWWVDVTYPMLEHVRKRLRNLVPLVERARKGEVYSGFEDVIGAGEEIELPGTAFNDFLDDKRYSKNQIQFVNLIIDYLTQDGTVEPGRIYESPVHRCRSTSSRGVVRFR